MKKNIRLKNQKEKQRNIINSSSYLVYILYCADDTLYIGSTNDIDRRLLEHNESKNGARYTKARRPVFLFYKEAGYTRSSALKREHELKKLTRKEKLELIKVL